jgi:hypothetical protein
MCKDLNGCYPDDIPFEITHRSRKNCQTFTAVIPSIRIQKLCVISMCRNIAILVHRVTFKYIVVHIRYKEQFREAFYSFKSMEFLIFEHLSYS